MKSIVRQLKIIGLCLVCMSVGWAFIEWGWNDGKKEYWTTASALPMFWAGMIYYHFLNKWEKKDVITESTGTERKTTESME